MVVAIVAVLVLVGAGFGTYALVSGDDDPEVTAPAVTDPITDPPLDPSSEPTVDSPTVSVSPAPELPTTSSAAPPPEQDLVDCWDFDRAPSYDQCTPFTGPDAIQFVFFGIDYTTCEYTTDSDRSYYDCTDDNGDLAYRLSEWPSYDAGYAAYSKNPGGNPGNVRNHRLRWNGVDAKSGGPLSAIMYDGYAFGAEIYGPDEDTQSSRAFALLMTLYKNLQMYATAS
ncbi:hypothetical protein BH11ACT8_BH11ACT8_21100 [soil metagenome]